MSQKHLKTFIFKNLEFSLNLELTGDFSETLPKGKWSISIEWMEPHLELIKMEAVCISGFAGSSKLSIIDNKSEMEQNFRFSATKHPH